MSILQIRTVIVVVVILLATNIYQCNEKPEPDNSRILELEAEKKSLEADKAQALETYSLIANQRDSALATLKLKPETDKLLIHKKHENIRNDIILLTDSLSVQLLSANLRRKRTASHN